MKISNAQDLELVLSSFTIDGRTVEYDQFSWRLELFVFATDKCVVSRASDGTLSYEGIESFAAVTPEHLRVRVFSSRHPFGSGKLKYKFTLYIPDAAYPDSVKMVSTKIGQTGIELTESLSIPAVPGEVGISFEVPVLHESLKATEDAIAAAVLAKEAAELANENAGHAAQMAAFANEAAEDANGKAMVAQEKAELADSKATLANQKADQADAAASAANGVAADLRQFLEKSRVKTISIDFKHSADTVQLMNMEGDITILKIATHNVQTLKMTHSNVLQQVIQPGVQSIVIRDLERCTWEITRTVENELAAVGVLYIQNIFLNNNAN